MIQTILSHYLNKRKCKNTSDYINPLVPLRTLEYVRIIFFKMLITLFRDVLFLSSLLCPTVYCRGILLLPPQRRYPQQSLHNS